MLTHFYDTLKELPVMTLKTAFTNNMVYSKSSNMDLYLAIKGDSVFYSNAFHSNNEIKKMNLYQTVNNNLVPVIMSVDYSTIDNGRLV